MRCSFCWKSDATKPLAPAPYTSIRPAPPIASTTCSQMAGSSCSAVSSTARASLNAMVAMICARSAPGGMSPPTTRASGGSIRRAASAASRIRSCG